MKRMMAVFFSGCVLIGIGIGIALMELSNWKTADFRTDLLDMPMETYNEEIGIDMSNIKNLEIHYGYYYLNMYSTETEIVYDESRSDSLLIEIDYHGTSPNVFRSSWEESPEGEISAYMLIDVNNYNNMEDVFKLISSMFDNKTYYRNGESSHLKKVTVYTAFPDKVTIS